MYSMNMISRSILWLLATLTLLQCRPVAKDKEVKEQVAKNTNDDKFSTKAEERTAQFVVEAVADNYAVINMSNLVIERGQDNGLKQFAVDLLKDHTMFQNGITRLAADKHITVPTEASATELKELEALKKLDARGFDKAWCDKLIEQKKKTITRFESDSANISDEGVKEWVAKVIPLNREHLTKLNNLRSGLK
jgi:putative membrane protein